MAIVLIVLAGELKVTRHMLRSSNIARDTEAASIILASELAAIRGRGIGQSDAVLPLPIPVDRLPEAPPGAEGEIRLEPHETTGLVQVEAVLAWQSVTGKREIAMSTLMRPGKEGER